MATELAKAYVQIIPSAEGIKGSITEALGGEASAAGNSSGRSLGQTLVSTLKTVIVTAGLGKVISSALTEGGNLQQSIGGVETLFKESADTIKQYAAEAYRTAGLSANDYMEQATSFSASLLQSMGGDTAAAAEIAQMAITDMADNANKMGTEVQSIQNAYQGFAKQNYTMLDNLKLGYGGTKSEMERLLMDAQKLTGVKYDLNNLDDVFNAIHVIQEELDITGTTAKESAETFSGSLASMKAAGKNVLANLALGEDIGPALNALEDTVFTFVSGNLLPMLGNVLSSVPEVLSNALSMAARGMNLAANNASEIANWGVDLIQKLVTGIISGAPYLAESAFKLAVSFGQALITVDWVQMAQNLISELRNSLDLAAGEILGTDGNIIGSVISALEENLPAVLNEGTEIVGNITEGILQALPGIFTAAGSMAMEIVNGIKTYLPQLFQMARGVCTELISGIMSNLPAILDAGVKMLLKLVQGILDSFPSIVSAAARVVLELVTTIGAHLPEVLQTGIALLGELIAGLIQSIPDLLKGAGEIIENFIEACKETDWGSIGSNIIEGIKNGLKAGVSAIVEAAKDVASSALNAAKDFLGIASPSKVMRDQVGQWIPAGIADGIRENVAPISEAMKQLTEETTDTLQADLSMGLSSQSQAGFNMIPADRGGGYVQNIEINSPSALSPYEVARQTRNATRDMVLAMRGR